MFGTEKVIKYVDLKEMGEAYHNPDADEDELAEITDEGTDTLVGMGFSGAGVGFGTYATIYGYKGKPVIAFHMGDDGLDGFEVHPDFQRRGFHKAFIEELLNSWPWEGKLKVVAPNEEAIRLLKKDFDFEFNESTGMGIVRRRK